MPESHYARGRAPREGILATQTVSGSEWVSAARLHNHIAGRGRVLIPAYCPGIATLSKNDYTFTFWIVPTYAALKRQWRIVMRSDGEVDYDIDSGAETGTVPVPGDFSSLESWDLPDPIIVDETLASQSATEGAVDVNLGSTIAGVSMDIDSIECWEYPRAFIAEGGTENGVNLAQFRGSQPIKAEAFTEMYAGSQDTELGKRVHFQWAVPYLELGSATTTYAKSTTSATYVNAFSVDIPALARKIYNDGNAYTTIKARVFAWVSSGGDGDVRITTDDGASSSANITVAAASAAWTADLAPKVTHDDLTEADGVPSVAGYDSINIEFRATTGTIYIASAIVYE